MLEMNVGLLVISLGSDLHSANGRVKNEVRHRMALHNARVLRYGRDPGKTGYVAIIDVACIGARAFCRHCSAG